MELSKLLEKQRPAILKTWLGEIFDAYPADTSRFLKGENDRFANPVGYTIAANTEYLLNGLIRKDDTASLAAHLEQIIRIRAVQDFTPAEDVSFIANLKTVITGQLETKIHKYNLWDEWGEFETRIDSLTLSAFEIHARMQEKIHHIRMNELEKSEKFLTRLMESRATRIRNGSSDMSAFSGCT
jgi:hypothetical protein